MRLEEQLKNLRTGSDLQQKHIGLLKKERELLEGERLRLTEEVETLGRTVHRMDRIVYGSGVHAAGESSSIPSASVTMNNGGSTGGGAARKELKPSDMMKAVSAIAPLLKVATSPLV